jgi:hypothetical protein
VVQPCVVTLAPVTTRIEEKVERRFRADLPEPAPGAEVEMPEDDALEPLPETLDLGRVLIEALALAVPEYPRADGASLGEAVFTEPGAEPDDRHEAPTLRGARAAPRPAEARGLILPAEKAPCARSESQYFPRARLQDGLDTARRTAEVETWPSNRTA